LTQVGQRNVLAGRRDVAESHARWSDPAAVSGAIRSWWGELTRPTRLLLSVNGVVIGGVGALAALLRLTQ
jgi:hypothetical protein